MSIAAGELNRAVRIDARSTETDAANQQVDVWVTKFPRLWARPLGQTGMSVIRSVERGVAVGPTKYSWRLRYRPTGIDTGMRLVYKGVVFDIVGITHDFERQQYTDLICETGANNG